MWNDAFASHAVDPIPHPTPTPPEPPSGPEATLEHDLAYIMTADGVGDAGDVDN